MARTARIQSESQIYHVMLRGINKQSIFNEPEDYHKLLQILEYCVEKSGIEVYAYCLMHNHIHLLLKEGNEPLGITFRRFGSKYVYWYNNKYGRIGHLFQDRYKSEPVEDDSYFLTVLRYIHMNPVKAGITISPEEYPYSSYANYFHPDNWINSKKVLTMISQKQFLEYHQLKNNDICLDMIENTAHVTEEQSKVLFLNITHCDSDEEFKLLNKKQKDNYIEKMKRQGIPLRQIAKLTGESYYYIQKIQSIKEPSPD